MGRAGTSVWISHGGVLMQLTRAVKPSLEVEQSVLQAKAVRSYQLWLTVSLQLLMKAKAGR